MSSVYVYIYIYIHVYAYLKQYGIIVYLFTYVSSNFMAI